MTFTSALYRAARLSADIRAARRGPKAYGKRLVRKQIGRAIARTGATRWPR